MLPFGALIWGHDHDNAPLIFDNYSAFMVTVLYIILLGSLFSFLTRPIQQIRWIILLAFCFSILSVILLNLILWNCGIAIDFE
jgi:hypothetical protein